jgi:hypothetical protein
MVNKGLTPGTKTPTSGQISTNDEATRHSYSLIFLKSRSGMFLIRHMIQRQNQGV